MRLEEDCLLDVLNAEVEEYTFRIGNPESCYGPKRWEYLLKPGIFCGVSLS